MHKALLAISLLVFYSFSDAATFIVSNTNDLGPGSLRQAIEDANATPGTDAVHFDIPGIAPHTINLLTALPVVAETILIEGNTQPANGYTGVLPKILIQNGMTGFNTSFSINGVNSEVRGLHLVGFEWGIRFNRADGFVLEENVFEANNQGIDVNWTDGATIQNNFISFLPMGSVCGNSLGARGMGLYYCDNIQVTGNIIPCTGTGIDLFISDSFIITGNYIGNDALGCSSSIVNGVSIMGGIGNQVGGLNPGDANVITSARNAGVLIRQDINFAPATESNIVQGNVMQCISGEGILLVDGGNNTKASPTILTATNALVTGIAEPGDIVEVYRQPDNFRVGCAANNSPQGDMYFGSATADLLGNWTLAGTFEGELVATATDATNGTSPFSVIVSSGVDHATFVSPCDGIVLDHLQFELFANQQGGKVILDWRTSLEAELQKISIERSEDRIHWQDLKIDLNSQKEGNHSAIDQNPKLGTNYYRLRAVNEEGEKSYSNIVFIYFAEESLKEIHVFPNPSTGEIQIRPMFNQALPKGTLVSFQDLNGKSLKKIRLKDHTENVILNFQDQPNGVYLIYVSGPNFNLYHKILKH